MEKQTEITPLTPEEIITKTFALVAEYAHRNLTPHYETEDQRHLALGLMASIALQWDGVQIVLMAAEALEDANYHDLAAELRSKAEML